MGRISSWIDRCTGRRFESGRLYLRYWCQPTTPTDRPIPSSNKLLTCDPAWNTNDHHGHGTQMTGLALYGDLNAALLSTSRISVPCEIESVKILPPTGANHPDLYGNVTEEAVNRATIADPHRDRIVCMAITSTDFRDRGQPSSWSAALDNICVGKSVEGKRHLFVVSAGNTDMDAHIHYPNSNITDQVHDPGQSWNALTVGAHTDKVTITETQFNGWAPLAEAGDIAPGTTTSVTWKRTKWPIKPDVVFEGGNAAIDQGRTQVDYPNSLLLLTTDRATTGSMFTWTADTSAASAQAANMAAVLSNEYAEFWPETLRALIVHSAEWTPRMRAAYPNTNKGERENLLRTCGYGVPDLNRARWSASNHLTLIAQDELKPFEGSRMKHLNIHNIPWPTEELRALGATEVKMKVTLSYFIEPNPARRGWEHKFRYQSHGLRFDVKTPTETADQFMTRLNRKRWDEELGRDTVTTAGDSAQWYFGEHIRSKGSVHSDVWVGTAADLAERSQLAVYPVVGWWREKHSEGHTTKKARYSLIISISTPSTEIDLYTPVETQVVTEVER
ncbi:MAG: S8 family peptidase [Bdellovibrionaceae bacterium]|nr:S8 family peptidase [Pseudobdellovibrionaceae bacterium]